MARISKFIDPQGNTYSLWEVIEAAEGSGMTWEQFVEERGLEELQFAGYDENFRPMHIGDDEQKDRMATAIEINGGPGGKKPTLTRFLANDDPNARDNFATAVKTNTLKGVFQQESAAVDYLYSIYNPSRSSTGVQFRHAEGGFDTVEIELTNGRTGQFNLAWKGEENMRAFDEIKNFMESRRTRQLNDDTKDGIRNVFQKVQNMVDQGGSAGWFLETEAQEGLQQLLPNEDYTIEEHATWSQAITITNPNGVKRHIYLGRGDVASGEKGTRYYSQNDENKYYARNMLDAAEEVIMFIEENEGRSEEWLKDEAEFIEKVEEHLTDEAIQEIYQESNILDLDAEDPDNVDLVTATIRKNLGMVGLFNWWSDREEFSSLENFEIDAIVKRVYRQKLNAKKDEAINDVASQFVDYIKNNPEEANYTNVKDFHEKYQLSKIDLFDDGTLIGASEKVIAGLNRELIYNIDDLDETQQEAMLNTIKRHQENIALQGDKYTMSLDLTTGKLIRQRESDEIWENSVGIENEIEQATNELIDGQLDITALDQLKTKYETNSLALTQIERILNTPIEYTAMLIGDDGGKLEELTLRGTYRDVIYQKEQGLFTLTTDRWNNVRKKAGKNRHLEGHFDDKDPDRIHMVVSDESFSNLQSLAPEMIGDPFEGRKGEQGIDFGDRFKGRDYLTEDQKYFDDIVRNRVVDAHKGLLIEEQALNRMFLLNEDVTSIEKDIWQNAGHMAVASIFGADQVQKWWGYSERAVLDEMVNQYGELGWELDDEQKAATKRDLGESVLEGVGGSVGILLEFAIANKATAAIRGAKLFSKMVTVADKTGKPIKTLQWRSLDDVLRSRVQPRYSNGKQVITTAQAEQRASKLGVTTTEYLNGLRPVADGMQKVKKFSKYGWKAIPANVQHWGEKVLFESLVEGLKFKAIGGDFTHGFGFGMAGVALTPLLGNVVNVSKRLQAAESVNAPAWLLNNSVRLEKAYQLAFKGPMSFAVGTEIGEIIHQTYESLKGIEGFGSFIDEHYSTNTEFTKQFMANLVIGGAFGLTHKANIFPGKGQGMSWNLNKLKREKAKVDQQIYERNEKGEYVGLRKEQVKWNPKTGKLEKTGKKMEEKDFVELFDTVRAYETQIQRHLYQNNLMDPIMGPTIIEREYAKQVEFYKQEGKILEYEAVNNKTNPEMANQRAKFEEVFGPDGKKTNKIKVTFNVDNYSRGVTPHELGHAGMYTLFGRNVRFKADFMKELLEISKKIKVDQINPETNKRMTLHEQMTLLKKKWGNSWEAGRINDWEMFSYVAEALGKVENMSALQGSNAFRALGDFIQRKLGKELNQNYDFTLQKDVVRFFGDYIESINKGTNSLKILKHLENVIDYKETKKGDDLQKQAERAAEQGYKKDRILEMQSAKRNFEELLGTTIEGVEVGLKSENLMKTKKQLFDENVSLLQNKPEKTGKYFPAEHAKAGQEMTWREAQKVNADKIREINKKLEVDERNIELIDKYKKHRFEIEGKETTELQKKKGDQFFEQIQKNNKEVLDLYVNTMHKQVEGGASRKNFDNYVRNTELLKIVNSYNPQGGTSFRTYLYGTLFGGGAYGGGRMGNILKALKVDMEVISKKSSLDRMMEESNFDVAEKTAVSGEGGPLTKLNGSKGAEIIYELNVPEVNRYIERFNELVEKGEGPFKDIETILNLDYNTLGNYSKKGTEFHDIILDIMGGKGVSAKAVQARGNNIADNWRLLYEVEPVYNLMKTSGKAMGVENSIMTDVKTGENVHYRKTGETVKAAKTGAKTGTDIQKKIPLSEFKNMAEAKKWYLETLGIRDNRTAQEIADGTGNVEILTKDRNIILTRQYSVLSTFSNGIFNQLSRKALAEGKLPDLQNRIAVETLANQIKAGGLTGKIPKTGETGKLEHVELYSELLDGFSKKFAGELGLKFGENKGGKYLINNEGLERMQDIFIDYAFGNKKNIPKHILNYIDSFSKYEKVFETKEAAANWARIEIQGYKGRVKKADFQTEFNNLKMEKQVIEVLGVDGKKINEFTITAADIVKNMNLSAGSYVYKGNKFVNETLVKDRVKRSVEFSQYLPKDIIGKLVKGGMTNSEAKGFVQHILGLHRRLSFEGIQSDVTIKKSGEVVATLTESGESIIGKGYTQTYSKVLKNLGKNTHPDLKNIEWSFVPEAKLRSASEKMANAKTEAERIKLAEESFSKLHNETKKDLYYAIESAKQDYIYSSKSKAEFLSRANWMYSIAKGNSNLVQGTRQTVPVHAIWFGKGKLTGDRIKLEHLKASVSQSVQTANLVVAGKFKQAGRDAAADFIGLTAPETMLKFIDNQGGLVNTAGLVRMAFLHPKLLKQFRTVDSGFKKTLYQEVVEKYGTDLFGKKKFVELLKNHNLVTKNQKADFLKKTGLNSENLTDGRSIPEMARIIDKAMSDGRLKNKKKKGMSTWDFDDTLAITKSGVRARIPNTDGKPKPNRKVIFLAGGAGSGKSNVVKKLGLEKDGFKIVNQDISLEWLKKNNGLPENMNDLTSAQRSTLGKLQHEARGIAKRKMMKYQGKADGVVIDGTGGSMKAMEKLVKEFKEKGYDVSMLFVETSLSTALARNKARKERSLLDKIVEKNHEAVQGNKSGFKTIFGERFMEVKTDKLKQEDAMPKELVEKMNDFVRSYEKIRLDAEQFASEGKNILDKGGKFDFSEFNVVTEGTKGPFFQKALDRAKKFGTEHQYVLTARPPESQAPIYEFLKSQGLDIPLKNITGLGNSTGEAKAMWMLEKFKEGYNDMYFADDAIANVKAVRNVLNKLDVKSKVQQAKMKMHSENMSKRFNEILFESTGMESYKEFSAAKGQMVGRKKWNIPLWKSWGAEDFMGLTTYAFSGRGKQGEGHLEFFRDHLEKPFSRAYNEIHTIKQNISHDYKALRKQFPEVRDILNEKIDGIYTVDHAIRVYNFNKAGFEIPGLSKRDQKTLIDFVRSDQQIQYFADQIGSITKLKEGYIKPKDHWLGENIQMDLNNAVDRVHRKEALSEFVENRESIFGKWENGKIVGKNMNKIEALYGPKHREALENMLWRMEKGTNRTVGADSNTNTWMNWINNATGTIMFFNQKSAMLQTISSLNYVNGSFNNPLRAARAFANQPQYWKDFAKIFNSDMLLQRRSGMKINVEAQELIDRVGTQQGGFARFRSYLLEKGFLPTKYADSFAIASGGASYYRNSVRKYEKQGMSTKEAEAKAWEDFTLMTEQTQQSSRPDLISMHQASALGRPILAFANTPMQMFRRHKRRLQDVANNRGNTPENIASSLYYGFAQTMVFSYLANAMFAVDDESDEPSDVKFSEKKKSQHVNTILDSYLRGMGTGGASVSALKNGILRFIKESEKDYNADYGNVVIDMLNVSPPIGSKARKIYTSLKTYKHDKEVMGVMGLDLDNPAILSTANIISALTNIPTDRVVMKLTNIKDATQGDYENWQRIAMLMGINKYALGEYDDEADVVKDKLKEQKKRKKDYSKLKEKYPDKSEKEIDEIVDFKKRTKEYYKLNKKQQMILIDVHNRVNKKYIDTRGFKEEDRVRLIEKLIKNGDITKDQVPPSLEYLFK